MSRIGARPRTVGCIVAALTLLPVSAAAAAGRTGPLPFTAPLVAAADNGETAVVWGVQRPFIGLQASVGTPGGRFERPLTLAPAGSTPINQSIAMDSAGDALVVWEQSSDDSRGNSSSLGVFASARPVGGVFGKPVQLAGPQKQVVATPLMAMSRSGAEIVAWRQGSRTLIATGRGGGVPAGATDLGVARFDPTPGAQFFDIQAVGLDEAGDATFAGTTAAGYPALLERSAAGAMGPLTPLALSDVRYGYRAVALGVGSGGQAVVAWRTPDGVVHAATRPAARSAFGVPATIAFGGPVGAQTAGIDGQGRALVAGVATIAKHTVLQVAQAASGGAFGPPTTLSDPSRDANPAAQLSVASDGDAALAWRESVGVFDPGIARVALSRAGGPFSSARTLKPATDEAADPPSVAVDGAGQVVPVWTSVAGDVERVLAGSVSDAGVRGPTVVTQAAAPPRAAALPTAPRVDAGLSQSVLIQRNGRIRLVLACVAPKGQKCRGTVSIDRPKRGRRKRMHVAKASYVFGAGSVHRTSMLVTRAARHAAAHATLTCTIVTRTKNPAGGTTTSSDPLFVLKRGSKPRAS